MSKLSTIKPRVAGPYGYGTLLTCSLRGQIDIHEYIILKVKKYLLKHAVHDLLYSIDAIER